MKNNTVEEEVKDDDSHVLQRRCRVVMTLRDNQRKSCSDVYLTQKDLENLGFTNALKYVVP